MSAVSTYVFLGLRIETLERKLEKSQNVFFTNVSPYTLPGDYYSFRTEGSNAWHAAF